MEYRACGLSIVFARSTSILSLEFAPLKIVILSVAKSKDLRFVSVGNHAHQMLTENLRKQGIADKVISAAIAEARLKTA